MFGGFPNGIVLTDSLCVDVAERVGLQVGGLILEGVYIGFLGEVDAFLGRVDAGAVVEGDCLVAVDGLGGCADRRGPLGEYKAGASTTRQLVVVLPAGDRG